MRFKPFLIGVAIALMCAGAAVSDGLSSAMTRLVETDLRPWINHPTIVDAIRAQNIRSRNLSLEEILALDRQWRAETMSVSKPMIQALMANALSSFLMQKKRASNGLYTEIFVMDDKGLNAGLSDMTSDYWQGDEDKWQKIAQGGADAVHIGPVIRDKSTHVVQSQVTLPVLDPITRKVIGAITVGINIARLPR